MFPKTRRKLQLQISVRMCRDIITLSFPIKKESDFVSRIIQPSENKATGSEKGGLISVSAGRMKIQFDRSNGMLRSINYDGADISILHGIAPIGTKFHAADNIGPSGLKNHADGLYEATVYFHFGTE
jgi:hypothetical protein